MLPDTSIITNWFQQVLDNSPNAIIALRAVRDEGIIKDFKFILVNRNAVHSIGRTDLAGKYFSKEFPGIYMSPLYDICIRVTEKGKPWSGQIQFDEGGAKFQAVINANKQEDGCLVSFTEITGSKKREKQFTDEKIHELNTRLNMQNRELAYLNSELKTFNTIAVNDYNDALKQVYLNLELLISNEANKLSDSGKAHLRRAQSTIQKLKLLTEDLTTYTQLKDPHSELEVVDLKALLEATISDIRTRREDLEIVFQCDDLPEITGYPSLLSLVFHHLLDNSVKFRRNNTVEIHISCTCAVKGHHVISFSDKGIGLTSDLPFEEMFNIFKRHHDKSKYKGSGIGLAICKKVMELHGGYITANGNPDGGATFNCYFPV